MPIFLLILLRNKLTSVNFSTFMLLYYICIFK